MSKLTGKVAIVTGASKGIGAAIAKALGAAGASVVVNYARGATRLSEITANGGKGDRGPGMFKAADVTRLFAETKKAFGRPTFCEQCRRLSFDSVESVTET